MSKHRLKLPVVQNWSCHNCSGCCRQHLIEVTEEERQRIEKQSWGPEDGIPEDQPVLERHSGRGSRATFRLAHQPDGACVFLREDGLCRIHAKYGEAAKPLPCRIYPYTFQPAGPKVAVSLRFSCPSVVRNAGQPVEQQEAELNRIAKLVVPSDIRDDPPPLIHSSERLDWADTLLFVEILDRFLISEEPLSKQLSVVNRWNELIQQSSFEQIRGPRLREFLELIAEAASAEVSESPAPDEPTSMARTQLRMLVGAYSKKDTVADLSKGIGHRLQLLNSGIRFARGKGMIPAMQDGLRSVPFSRIEKPHGWPEVGDECLRRMLRVKIGGLHFFGRGYYGAPFVEGLRALTLEVVAIQWITRWLAASADRDHVVEDDIEKAITIVDHHHGFSELLGKRTARGRVGILARANQIESLLHWYSRSV